ncbi:hypothetical protein CR513_44353, partial [Mucuna pruriens]
MYSGVLSIEERRLGTEKPKVAGGDRLEYQRTPEDLILSVLASQGEPSSSPWRSSWTVEPPKPNPCSVPVAFVCTQSKPSRIDLCQDRLGSVSVESDSVITRTNSATNSDLPFANAIVSSSNIFTKPGQMENHDRMLKELVTLDVVYQPWCIQYPQLEPAQTYELKSSLIHLLPKFHDLAREDPHKHLKEFHMAVGDPRRLHQNEGIPILPGWSLKGLAISAASTIQHQGRYEKDLPREILPSLQDYGH